MWFRSKYRDLAESLSVELSEARTELTAEMHRRIAAETLAEDRAQQIERAYELLAQANESRDAAIAERLKSLDLVNTALLAQAGPEKPPPDIKQYTKVPGPPRIADLRRQADSKLIRSLIDEQNKRIKGTKPVAEHPPARIVQ